MPAPKPLAQTPPGFRRAVSSVLALERDPRYLGAFIFGSVAEGNANENSDLDVKVLVDADNKCRNVNHPHVDGIKVDISFLSAPQLEKQMGEELRASWNRSPNLATAIILFDKTGELTKLQKKAQRKKPASYGKDDYQWVQFMLYHADDKVRRSLEEDSTASLYSMHANIGEVLKIHYQLNGKWWLSSKNILNDLKKWDKSLADMLSGFVATAEARIKFDLWTKIVDHVAAQMGGRQPIRENNCDCLVCQKDLSALLVTRGGD